MEEKDKEAFNEWRNSTSTRLDIHDAWKAACEYSKQEYSNIMDAMSRTSHNNAKLQAENKKLREALEFYAVNSLAKVEVGQKIDERLAREFYVKGSYAREALKEVVQE
jgi:regulator of replication initiation timing